VHQLVNNKKLRYYQDPRYVRENYRGLTSTVTAASVTAPKLVGAALMLILM